MKIVSSPMFNFLPLPLNKTTVNISTHILYHSSQSRPHLKLGTSHGMLIESQEGFILWDWTMIEFNYEPLWSVQVCQLPAGSWRMRTSGRPCESSSTSSPPRRCTPSAVIRFWTGCSNSRKTWPCTDDIFVFFDVEPVGSASIVQVRA